MAQRSQRISESELEVLKLLWDESPLGAAIRLARFNTLLEKEQPPFAKEFFVGVPAPAGGLLLLLPLIIEEQVRTDGWWNHPIVVGIWTVVVAMLLVSRIPTLSVKTVKVPPRAVAPRRVAGRS